MTRSVRVLLLVVAGTFLLGASCHISIPDIPFPTPPPSPSPTVEPSPSPTVEPTPEPTPTPSPSPSPSPSPVVNPCPKYPLAPDARIAFNAKRYGQGLDSTPWVENDSEFCEILHGVPEYSCKLEGWPTQAECEILLMGGCPVWEYRVGGGPWLTLHDDHSAAVSGDHYGNPIYRDDPQTPTTGDTLETLQGFEGEPKVCGLQRDSFGPMAGFFVIAHGLGEARACTPQHTGCSTPVPFDH